MQIFNFFLWIKKEIEVSLKPTFKFKNPNFESKGELKNTIYVPIWVPLPKIEGINIKWTGQVSNLI